tara:strand:- start:512 stop:1495 length:984 start_codon:yes stop_codon:yes gene_type:complete
MIFSDTYTVKEVYSVLRQEHLYTSSMMPWLYTSLKDVKYQPAIADNARNNINEIFVFDYLISGVAPIIENERKEFRVNHNGNEHLSYESRVILSYNALYQQRQLQHLIDETNTSHLRDAYDKATEVLHTLHANPDARISFDKGAQLVGYLYDISGTPTAIKVKQGQGLDYNITGNEVMSRLVAHCKRNPLYLDGEMIFHADGRESFRLNCQYHTAFWRERKNKKETRSVITSEINREKIELRDEQISREHLYGLSSAKGDFLTEEHGKYINSVFPDTRQVVFDNGVRRGLQNFRVDFEFVFENNELVDILLFRTTHNEFKEIETLIP